MYLSVLISLFKVQIRLTNSILYIKVQQRYKYLINKQLTTKTNYINEHKKNPLK